MAYFGTARRKLQANQPIQDLYESYLVIVDCCK
jgi:hypothetical protein